VYQILKIIAKVLFTVVLVPFFAQVWKKFLAMTSPIVSMWGFKSVVKRAPYEAANIADSIMKVYFDLKTPWAKFVSAYVEQMTGHKINVGDLVGKSIGTVTDGPTRAFVSELFKDMLSLVMPDPETLKMNPLEGGERFLAANLKFQMDAWWLHVLGDMLSFGIFKSLKDLPNAISWSMGLGWLSWLVMGTPFRIGIVGPMERKFNAIYTPERLTVSQLIDATQRGLVDAYTFISTMKEMGYDPDVSSMLYTLAEKELSRSELQRLYEQRIITEDQLKEKLLSMGYPQTTTEILSYLMTNDRILDLKSKIATEVLELYSEKKITDTTLSEYYSSFGYSNQEIQYVKILGQLRMDTKPKLTTSEMISLFRTRIIGYLDILEDLTSKGYNEKEAILYVLAHVPQDEWKQLIPDAWFQKIFKSS
jgi:hypothetical protein